jgi:hypothetical protein
MRDAAAAGCARMYGGDALRAALKKKALSYALRAPPPPPRTTPPPPPPATSHPRRHVPTGHWAPPAASTPRSSYSCRSHHQATAIMVSPCRSSTGFVALRRAHARGQTPDTNAM